MQQGTVCLQSMDSYKTHEREMNWLKAARGSQYWASRFARMQVDLEVVGFNKFKSKKLGPIDLDSRFRYIENLVTNINVLG